MQLKREANIIMTKKTYLKRDKETGRFISGKKVLLTKGVSKENAKNSISKIKLKIF